jgi:hypothetical protein
MSALGIKFKLKSFKFNNKKWSETRHQQTILAQKMAARAWVEAVVVRIPVWSGQALGSIKFAQGRSGESSGMFLFQFLKMTIPITPGPVATFLHRTPKKNAITGGAQGRFTFTSNQNTHQYTFTFFTSIIYFIIQDFFNISISPSAPWGSMEAGKKAWHETIRSEIKKRLSGIAKFIDEDNEIRHG